MSNWSVSSTRTSWPRCFAASTSTRVLYRASWRDKMTIRMTLLRPRSSFRRLRHSALPATPQAAETIRLLVRAHQILLVNVHQEIAFQGLAPQQHAETHTRPVRDRQQDTLAHRA